MEVLPHFRTWAQKNHEEAHPTLTKGQPDFLYSAKAAQWVKEKGFDPRRFFCVMGKMAAALVVVEEGNDFHGTRPLDMPKVEENEVKLAAKNLDKMLTASGKLPTKTVLSPMSVPSTKPVLPPKPKP
ncbi:MAG: hypothetical protein IK079_00860 [Desulfovibrio sp.]|nr:hypothetical protein [Desulfovibrio sp.]